MQDTAVYSHATVEFHNNNNNNNLLGTEMILTFAVFL